MHAICSNVINCIIRIDCCQTRAPGCRFEDRELQTHQFPADASLPRATTSVRICSWLAMDCSTADRRADGPLARNSAYPSDRRLAARQAGVRQPDASPAPSNRSWVESNRKCLRPKMAHSKSARGQDLRRSLICKAPTLAARASAICFGRASAQCQRGTRGLGSLTGCAGGDELASGHFAALTFGSRSLRNQHAERWGRAPVASRAALTVDPCQV